MRNLIVVTIASLFIANTAFAASCADQAAEKKLAGAAKNSFMTKCEKDTPAATPAVSACDAKLLKRNWRVLPRMPSSRNVKRMLGRLLHLRLLLASPRL